MSLEEINLPICVCLPYPLPEDFENAWFTSTAVPWMEGQFAERNECPWGMHDHEIPVADHRPPHPQAADLKERWDAIKDARRRQILQVRELPQRC